MAQPPSQSPNWFIRFLSSRVGAPATPPPGGAPSNDPLPAPPASMDTLADAAPLPYRVRADFLAAADAAFLQVLQGAVGDRFWLCPNVNLADLFVVPRGSEEVAQRNQIAQQQVAVVLCDRHTLRPQLAIALDDRNHARPDQVARDAFVNKVFAGAQFPLLRVPVQRTYTPQQVVALIDQVLPQAAPDTARVLGVVQTHDPVPFCPQCGAVMVRRQVRRGQQRTTTFYGCPTYPQCRGKVPIAAV